MALGVDDSLANWMVVRRMLLLNEQAAARRAGKKVKTKSVKELMDEERALLDPGARRVENGSQRATARDDNRIRLADLIRRLDDLRKEPPSQVVRQEQMVAATRTTTEISIEFKSWAPVQGLVVRNRNLAESDRYAFEFKDGSTFSIIDKWSNKSTTIWGDPHVDTSDQEGNRNGEFSDLKSSDSHTTLMLEDGTRVTFTAKDNGIIEQVDIFKGSQHIKALGAGSQEWSEEGGLFASSVKDDASSALSLTPMGDAVYAGGDGNDWFDVSGRLVWGQTTGPKPSYSPSGIFSMQVKQTTEQMLFYSRIDRQA